VVVRCRPAGALALIDGLSTHQSHQPLYPFAVNHMALRLKPGRHSPRAIEWRAQILTVDERHQFEFLDIDLQRAVVERRATQSQQFALPSE
jgi:hypothetical protein